MGSGSGRIGRRSGQGPSPASFSRRILARALLMVLALALVPDLVPGLAPGLARAASGAGRILPAGLDIRAASALVVDETGVPLLAKSVHEQRPIASVTKLMTALVILRAGLPLDEPITIIEADRDRMRWSRSRLRIDRKATLPRDEMLAVALMSSDNRAAAALGRTAFPGGTAELVEAMNKEAERLGMTESRFADPTGLDAGNVSTAADLVKLIRAAAEEPLIRGITSTGSMQVAPYGDGATLEYRNTNPLVRNDEWHIKLSKTGYIHEAGRCLVMRAEIAGRRLDIVLLGAQGKLTPVGDSNRLRKWLQTHPQAARIDLHTCWGVSDPDCWE